MVLGHVELLGGDSTAAAAARRRRRANAVSSSAEPDGLDSADAPAEIRAADASDPLGALGGVPGADANGAVAEATYASLALATINAGGGADAAPSLASLLELEVNRVRLGVSSARRDAALTAAGVNPADVDPTAMLRSRRARASLAALANEKAAAKAAAAAAAAAEKRSSLSLASMSSWDGLGRVAGAAAGGVAGAADWMAGVGGAAFMNGGGGTGGHGGGRSDAPVAEGAALAGGARAESSSSSSSLEVVASNEAQKERAREDRLLAQLAAAVEERDAREGRRGSRRGSLDAAAAAAAAAAAPGRPSPSADPFTTDPPRDAIAPPSSIPDLAAALEAPNPRGNRVKVITTYEESVFGGATTHLGVPSSATHKNPPGGGGGGVAGFRISPPDPFPAAPWKIKVTALVDETETVGGGGNAGLRGGVIGAGFGVGAGGGAGGDFYLTPVNCGAFVVPCVKNRTPLWFEFRVPEEERHKLDGARRLIFESVGGGGGDGEAAAPPPSLAGRVQVYRWS